MTNTIIQALGLTFLPEFAAPLTFDEVDAAHSWVNRDAPRDECFMSTTGAPYTYGSGRGERTYNPIPFSAGVESIRRTMNACLGVDYEVCFSNKYIDGGKHLGWHADDSPSIDHGVGIAIVSFGGSREIWFREAIKDAPVSKLLLTHGSLCLMPPGFQQTHQHRIPKAGREVEPRISLTFRKLK